MLENIEFLELTDLTEGIGCMKYMVLLVKHCGKQKK